MRMQVVGLYQSSWISGCRADRVDLSGDVVDLPGKHGEVFGKVLADPG